MAERRTFAAPVTPLRAGGTQLDEEAVAPLVDFLAAGGVDGVLAAGTNGEGVLLSTAERRRVAELFLEASAERLAVFVHCGAQSTAATAELAAHAAEIGADGVSVIAPPYFPLDDRALTEHLAAAAAACAPLPFYVYAFSARSGYPIPLGVIERLRETAPNLAGLKLSETPWERFEPYLLDGLEIFVGPEALLHRAVERGAVGAISALASAFPELVAETVRSPSAERAERLGALRASVQRFPTPASFKHVLGLRGVPIRPDVRAPLRLLDPGEAAELEAEVAPFVAGEVEAR
jgi:dihydrodipicolinate synthase/N-acetylneuraminate lyase